MASNVQMDDFSMSKHTLNRTMWHSEEKKLHAREHLADWTTWFNMTGGDEINKRRIDFQDKAGVITLLDCNISRHF